MGLATTGGAALIAAQATNPVGWAMLAGGALLGGILGGSNANSTAQKVGALQSQSADIQNQIYAEEFAVQKENLLSERRNLFRQGAISTAGASVAAAASGMSRSSSFSAIKDNIAQTVTDNVAKVDSSIASGEKITGLNQQQATVQAEIATAQAEGQATGGILSALF